jgi:ABC-2 type transport system ATP-binding protein
MSIEISHLTFRVPNRSKAILNDISFNVEKESIYTLLGPNGSGKTTIMKILSTSILPTSGRVLISGFDVVKDARKVRSLIGLCSDSERTFYYRLTGYQNLEFFANLYGLSKKELKVKLQEIIELVGLKEFSNVLFMNYSHGMKKKLALARCLINNPSILLLDEPNSGVDPLSAIQIRETIRFLRSQGNTILLSTHDLSEASLLSNYVGILKEGRLIVSETLDKLNKISSNRRMTIELMASKNEKELGLTERMKEIEKLKIIPNIIGVNIHDDSNIEIEFQGDQGIKSIIDSIAKSNLPVLSMTVTETDLEEVFLKLVGEKV